VTLIFSAHILFVVLFNPNYFLCSFRVRSTGEGRQLFSAPLFLMKYHYKHFGIKMIYHKFNTELQFCGIFLSWDNFFTHFELGLLTTSFSRTFLSLHHPPPYSPAAFDACAVRRTFRGRSSLGEAPIHIFNHNCS